MLPASPTDSPGNPFAVPGQWFRGNLHTHSTESDGALAPEAVLDWHAAHGYHFVAITDHDRITAAEPGGSSQVGQQSNSRFLALPGAELSLGRTRQGSPMHCVAVGLTEENLPERFDSPGAGVEWVWAQGGFGFVAHPHWSGFSTDELAGLGEVPAVEIFNTSCARENNKGHALAYWDDLLGRGLRAWGLATDDSHWRDLDYEGGWVMAKTGALTASGILGALRAGHFYSTGGPRIEDLRVEAGRLWVRTSPAAAIYWIGAGRLGWSVHAAPGQSLTEAEFVLKGKPPWLRVEVCDGQGRWAWSNPLPVGAA